MTTLALPEPSGNVTSPPGRVDWRAPTARVDYARPVDGSTCTVGFSPIGEAPPAALTEVLMHGSHAVLSARHTEAIRAERSGLIAAYADVQIAIFLEMCAAAELSPPIPVKVVAEVPRTAWVGPRNSAPHEIYAAGVTAADDAHEVSSQAPEQPGHPEEREHPNRQANGRGSHRGPASGRRRFPMIRRERLRAWPVPSWRCEGFPSTGRSLHLFIAPDGRLFEGRDDPWPLAALGQQVEVWPVSVSKIVETLAEVDARRCAVQLVRGMAHLLWRSGIGL